MKGKQKKASLIKRLEVGVFIALDHDKTVVKKIELRLNQSESGFFIQRQLQR